MLVATGTTDEGVAWALNALTDERLSYKLDGNLVLVAQEEDVRATDTRAQVAQEQPGISYADLVSAMITEATVTPMPTPTATPEAMATPTPMGTPISAAGTAAPAARSGPVWLIPLLIISILIVAGAVGIYVWQSRS